MKTLIPEPGILSLMKVEIEILSYIRVYQTTQSQSRATFFYLNDQCVVFKSARQSWRRKSPEGMKNPIQIMHLEPRWQRKWPIYDFKKKLAKNSRNWCKF